MDIEKQKSFIIENVHKLHKIFDDHKIDVTDSQFFTDIINFVCESAGINPVEVREKVISSDDSKENHPDDYQVHQEVVMDEIIESLKNRLESYGNGENLN